MTPKEYAKLVHITEIVCEYFGCDKELISEKQGDYLRYSTARHFIWYLAHYQIPVVINELSLVFKRKQNAIKKGIAKIKFSIGHERYYRNIYEDIIQKNPRHGVKTCVGEKYGKEQLSRKDIDVASACPLCCTNYRVKSLVD